MKIQIKKINLNHSLIFFLLCNLCSFIFLNIESSVISPSICLVLILIIGVSHGSLDHIKGKKLLKLFQLQNILFFYLIYLTLAISVVILWVIMPMISLVIFLIVASFHFGKEDTQFLIDENSYLNHLLFFFKGSLIILAPMYFHFNETISIFKLLLVENEFFFSFLSFVETSKILVIGMMLSTLASVYLFIKKFELAKFTFFFDYFSIIILNYYFQPLLAFTIYFCFLHSIRHIISLAFELDFKSFGNGLTIFSKKAVPLTVLTATFCLIGLYFLNNNYDLDSSILKVIFIGLASLTFPHILLEYLIERNEK